MSGERYEVHTPGIIMSNLDRAGAIGMAVAGWPRYIIRDAAGRDVTRQLVDPHIIEGKLVCKLDGMTELVTLPNAAEPAGIRNLVVG